MKTFAKMRSLEEVIRLMEAKGFVTDRTSYDKGGDFVCFEGGIYLNETAKKVGVQVPVFVAIGVFGRFCVNNRLTDETIATQASGSLDDVEWYSDLLNVIYVQ